MRILIVEDDAEMRTTLQHALEQEAFVVDCAPDGQKGSYMGRVNDYDLVLLDNVLPYKTGIEVCREIRQSKKDVPIMIISVRSEIDEKVILLDSGADDYLLKPYSYKELLARIRALTRRPIVVEATTLVCGALTLDTSTCEVWKGKKQIYLTRKEFCLLELLLRNKGKIVSRGMIHEHVWDMDGDPFSKTVETHILNLRKKMGRGLRHHIANVPGRGYKMSD